MSDLCYPTAVYQMKWVASDLSMSFHKIAPTMIGGVLIESGHAVWVAAQFTYSRLYLVK